MHSIKYSKRLGEIASVAVVDGEIVKFRGEHSEVTENKINKMKLNYENILIQNGDKMEIYCSEDLIKVYLNEIFWIREIYNTSKEKLSNISIYSENKKILKNDILEFLN